MCRRWVVLLAIVMALMRIGPAAAVAEVLPEPLVYYQLLVLSFLTRSACGEDVRDWPDDLHIIRDILKRDLGYDDRQLAAIEARAEQLRLTVPCGSDASRDLMIVTADEPRLGLNWFKALKSARNP